MGGFAQEASQELRPVTSGVATIGWAVLKETDEPWQLLCAVLLYTPASFVFLAVLGLQPCIGAGIAARRVL